MEEKIERKDVTIELEEPMKAEIKLEDILKIPSKNEEAE